MHDTNRECVNVVERSCELCRLDATFRRIASPYRIWLPVRNQTSRSSTLAIGQRRRSLRVLAVDRRAGARIEEMERLLIERHLDGVSLDHACTRTETPDERGRVAVAPPRSGSSPASSPTSSASSRISSVIACRASIVKWTSTSDPSASRSVTRATSRGRSPSGAQRPRDPPAGSRGRSRDRRTMRVLRAPRLCVVENNGRRAETTTS